LAAVEEKMLVNFPRISSVDDNVKGVKTMSNLEEILIKRKKNRDRLEKEAPNLFNGYNELMKNYYKDSALDQKYKELIAVGAAVATRCIPCLANHASNAISNGATREEIIDAAAIGVEFGGGPSFVVVRDNLLDFLDDIAGEGK
jgi:pyruvate dehydrogenase E2 component (dihydrolipoamide acetyltransferase)